MIFKSKLSPREKKNMEILQADLDKAISIIEYLSMMTDVEIPSESEEKIDEREI